MCVCVGRGGVRVCVKVCRCREWEGGMKLGRVCGQEVGQLREQGECLCVSMKVESGRDACEGGCVW